MLRKLFAIVLLSGTLVSCDKIKDLVKFDAPVTTTVTFDIAPVTTTEQTTLSQSDVRFNVDSLLKAESSKLSVNNIKSVKIQSVDMVANTSTANDNFTALDNLTVQLASNNKPGFVQVAAISSPANPTSLSVPINSDLELKDYFAATNFSYKITGKAKRVTTTTIRCTATIKYKITAGL